MGDGIADAHRVCAGAVEQVDSRACVRSRRAGSVDADGVARDAVVRSPATLEVDARPHVPADTIAGAGHHLRAPDDVPVSPLIERYPGLAIAQGLW